MLHGFWVVFYGYGYEALNPLNVGICERTFALDLTLHIDNLNNGSAFDGHYVDSQMMHPNIVEMVWTFQNQLLGLCPIFDGGADVRPLYLCPCIHNHILGNENDLLYFEYALKKN